MYRPSISVLGIIVFFFSAAPAEVAAQWFHAVPVAGEADGAPAVASGTSPTSWYTTPENVEHIAYVGADDQRIHELAFAIGPTGQWSHKSPGGVDGAPAVASGTSPTSWYTTPENVEHIAYVGADDHRIHELAFAIGPTGQWFHVVPVAGEADGAPAVASGTSPTSWYTTPENVEHIAYVGADDQRIHELAFAIGPTGQWSHKSPGGVDGAPAWKKAGLKESIYRR